jgi:ubiquinone/menaquinone biosynthesis C-methylase UbiE
MFEREQIENLYRERAEHYDAASQLYRLAGFRLERYRRLAVDALALRTGDTVVEIGCGTGANLALLRAKVGDGGHVVGVDLSEAMLAEARAKVDANGWRNVALIRTDAASFEFPPAVDGILSVLALTLVPEYDEVIARGAEALRPGGRWVVFDLKLPEWPAWLVDVGVVATRSYGVDRDMAMRHPWESIQRHLDHSVMRELYLGAAYLITGTKAATAERAA